MDFDKLPGVISTTSGYTGGHVSNPTYDQVSRGGTGHAESVEIVFDPGVVSYDQLLDHYWHNIDPFVAHRQFCDVGEQYRPEIFIHSEEQRAAAEASRQRIQNRFTQPILVKVTSVGELLPRGGVHQDYHKPTRHNTAITVGRAGATPGSGKSGATAEPRKSAKVCQKRPPVRCVSSVRGLFRLRV